MFIYDAPKVLIIVLRVYAIMSNYNTYTMHNWFLETT